MLSIQNLKASLKDGTSILKGVNLTVQPGEIHAIMGPNGSGKSSLFKAISGHPSYQIDSGSVTLNGKDILNLDISDRANSGLFISMQYPIEIPGVKNMDFLRMALDSKRAYLGLEKIKDSEFNQLMDCYTSLLEMDDRYRNRGVNEGFSGGEKKRNEILQMAILDPLLACLDETDSGLDIDALRIVARGINELMTQKKALFLSLITNVFWTM